MPLEKAKLKLLTHSKNMLVAAQLRDWSRFSELEVLWLPLLQAVDQEYGSEVNDIGEALIEDNQLIQSLIQKEQKVLLQELEQSSKNTSSLKSYLK